MYLDPTSVDTVVLFSLPHWRGRYGVLHLYALGTSFQQNPYGRMENTGSLTSNFIFRYIRPRILRFSNHKLLKV